jgi:hypothetical protein
MNQQPLLQIMDYEQLKQQLMTLVGDIKSLDDAIKSIKPLTDIYKGASGSADSRKAQEDLIGANQKLKQTQDELIKSIQQYKTLQEQVTALQEKYAKMQNEGASGTAALKDRQRELNQEIQKTAQASNAAEGSIKQLRAQLSLLTAEYDKMSAAQRNTAAGTALKDQIAGQVTALKQLEAETGRFQRNVGNYTGAIQILEKQLQEIKVKMDQFTRSGQGNSAEMQNLRKEHDLLEQALTRQTRGFSSLTMEVRNNERQLALMAEENMQGTEAFKQLQMATANAKREITIFNQEQRLLSSQAPTLAAATVAAKGLAGIYATGAGAAALFADGNEKVEKELQKLVAIMTILQGLEEFHQLIEKKGTVIEIARIAAGKLKNFVLTGNTQGLAQNTAATIANAEANELGAVAANTASKAMVGLRVALIATGIGALLVLLPSIVGAMGLFKDKAEDAANAQSLFNEAMSSGSSEYSDAVKNVEELRLNIDLAKQGFLDKTKVVEQYNDTIGKTTGKVSDLDEAEKALNKNADAYVKFTLYKAAANIALQESAKKVLEGTMLQFDVEQQEKQAQKFIGKDGKTFFGMDANSIRKKVDAYVKTEKEETERSANALENIAKDFQAKAAKIAKDNHFNFFQDDDGKGKKAFDPSSDIAKAAEENEKLQNEFRQLDLADQQKYLQQIVDDERNSYDLRLNALQLLHDSQKLQADEEAKTEEKIIKIKLDRIREIENKAGSKRSDEEKKELINKKNIQLELELAEAKHASKTFDINLALNNKLGKLAEEQKKKLFDNQMKDISGFKSKDDLRILTDEANALDELDAKYEQGAITVEEYNKQKEEIQKAATIDKLIAERKEILAQIDAYQKAGKDITYLEVKALDVHMKIEEAKTKKTEKETDKRSKLEHDMQKKVADDMVDFGKNLIDGVYQKQLNAIQKQIDLNTQWKDAEIERINNSTLSEQDKAAKLAQINAQAQAKQDQLDKQKRDTQLRQAKFDREASILKVVEETAIAVATDNATPGLEWKVPYDIALGALQIGAILAKPLPTYYTGTKSAQGGLALTDEKGAELYIEPGGNMFIGNDAPTFRNIKAGTEIVPHDQVNEKIHQMILQGAINRGDIQKQDESAIELREVKNLLRWQTAEFKKALEKQKTPKVVINHNGAFNDWKRKNIYE